VDVSLSPLKASSSGAPHHVGQTEGTDRFN
jgi:hypothetical protein